MRRHMLYPRGLRVSSPEGERYRWILCSYDNGGSLAADRPLTTLHFASSALLT